jgi:glycosyltransferase involved in cell wall biosynthesis
MKIWIVIPCYNEEKRFEASELIDFIKKNDIHFCLVNDGSTDDTITLLNRVKEETCDKVKVINLKTNVGKAEAVRTAFQAVLSKETCDFIGYLDADLSTPLEEIHHLAQPFNDKDFFFIFASRVKLIGKNIKRKASKHFLGRVFATAASYLLKMPVYDTQCGAKIFNVKMIDDIFRERFVSSWFFDIEIFIRYIKKYTLDITLKSILEVPLNKWEDKGGSKLKLWDYLSVPVELLKIKIKYR